MDLAILKGLDPDFLWLAILVVDATLAAAFVASLRPEQMADGAKGDYSFLQKIGAIALVGFSIPFAHVMFGAHYSEDPVAASTIMTTVVWWWFLSQFGARLWRRFSKKAPATQTEAQATGTASGDKAPDRKKRRKRKPSN